MGQLRPRDVAALARETDRKTIGDLLTGSYDDFCTCVVAEATRWVPPELRKALRRPQWLDDWIDALLGAEGDLQVAVFRARLQQGPQGDRTISNGQALAAVRTRLHEARALAKQRRQISSAARSADTGVVRWATKQLVREHRGEFADLVGAQLQAVGVDPGLFEDIPAGDSELARWVLAHGVDGVTTPSGRVRQLQALPDDAFRQVVACDVQRDPAEPALAHPVLLEHWGQTLRHLAQMTTDQLGIPLRPHAAVADADLSLASLADGDAVQRINQLRFLVHVRQRWLEHATRVRQLRRHVSGWREERIQPALQTAREQLRQAHARQYADLLAQAPAEPTPMATPASDNTAARQPPQAMTAFAERVKQLGWTVRIDHDDDRIRLDAKLSSTATIRLSYRRKRKGRGGGTGWFLTYLAILVNGQPGWTLLPTIADALDLATYPALDLTQRVLLYRQTSSTPGNDGSTS